MTRLACLVVHSPEWDDRGLDLGLEDSKVTLPLMVDTSVAEFLNELIQPLFGSICQHSYFAIPDLQTMQNQINVLANIICVQILHFIKIRVMMGMFKVWYERLERSWIEILTPDLQGKLL